MFYCQECADQRKWPESMFTSYGKCECCGKVRSCYDTPSRYLPTPKRDAD